MKALVWHGGNALDVEERVLTTPPAGSVHVRVRASGVCATDLHIMAGRMPDLRPPKVFGHEFAGEVHTLGAGVNADLLGRRVLVDPVIGCGACVYCRAGRKILCRAGGELGTSGSDGGHAEFVTVPAANLYALPAHVSFAEAALVEPLDCTLGAFRRAAPRAGESAVIFGSGPAGLLFVALARLAGCAPILLVGRGKARLELGRRMGATAAWDYQDPKVEGDIALATSGEGPDIAVEAAGAAVARAIACVRRGGRVVLYGLGEGAANIASDAVIAKDLTLVTGIGDERLWGEALGMVASGEVEVRALVTHRFSLADAAHALRAARDIDSAVKIMFEPHGASP